MSILVLILLLILAAACAWLAEYVLPGLTDSSSIEPDWIFSGIN